MSDIARWAEAVKAHEAQWSDAFVYFKHEESGIGPKLAQQMIARCRANEILRTRGVRVEDRVAGSDDCGDDDAKAGLLPTNNVSHDADDAEDHFECCARDADPDPHHMPDGIRCRDDIADAEADENAAENPADVVHRAG